MDTLLSHLAHYGIEDISIEDFSDWASQKLDKKVIDKIIKYQDPIAEGKPTFSDFKKFYEYSAQPRIESVVHSMKTDSIRASGNYIEKQLKDRLNILDIGCNIGYLTSYYALQNRNRNVEGWDICARSIQRAEYYKENLGLENLSFKVRDICKYSEQDAFDAIISSQILYSVPNINSAVKNIYETLTKDGRLILVEPSDEESTLELMEVMKKNKLSLIDFSMCYYMIDGLGAYSCFIFDKSNHSVSIDFKSEYDLAIKKIESC